MSQLKFKVGDIVRITKCREKNLEYGEDYTRGALRRKIVGKIGKIKRLVHKDSYARQIYGKIYYIEAGFSNFSTKIPFFEGSFSTGELELVEKEELKRMKEKDILRKIRKLWNRQFYVKEEKRKANV